ncbi:MAG: 6-carboxytetrahydropterin synthase QueD [Chloroflexi bacterium]|nr:6-carboxytetrahydropterin synthase QueD [Chloroflexota bacterium]MCH9040034.1 6-carboxytetrahydropterin synthase QueD [Chloroflexota bacterium]MCI0790275.1 6-carboxytetrahydropterin synthase QueD [Chloroflexota bacterium]MCI0795385.1 6-carboxytetrahydropterin synthase QueD [Chloroflexota bacterium]MCI0822990.1 6-carboxytetrahydropterin synthase QueD [Chloroflexota bacterium]
MEIYKVFTCESAHRLPNVEEDNKCGRLHGHSYRFEVWVDGPVDQHTGWVMDLHDISKAFQPIHGQMDHHYLNEIEGLSNPTSENIARWIWQQISPALPCLSRVVVYETCTSGCIYRGEGGRIHG